MKSDSLTAIFLTPLFWDKTLRLWLIIYQGIMALLGRYAA